MHLYKILGLTIITVGTAAALVSNKIDMGMAMLIYAILLSVIPNQD